jgi:2Fe-2S ferredoxin
MAPFAQISVMPKAEVDFYEVRVAFGSESRTLHVTAGEHLMQAIRDAGLPMAGDCGGVCSCATCHVYIHQDWIDRLPRPGANESALLEIVDDPTPLSRLACQIELNDRTDGLVVSLTPGA